MLFKPYAIRLSSGCGRSYPLTPKNVQGLGKPHRTLPVYRCWRGHRKPCNACKWSGPLSLHTWHRMALDSSCLRTAVTLACQSQRSCTGFFLGGFHCGRNVFSPISSATDITKAADFLLCVTIHPCQPLWSAEINPLNIFIGVYGDTAKVYHISVICKSSSRNSNILFRFSDLGRFSHSNPHNDKP